MEYKWNLYKIYESDEAWSKGKDELLSKIDEFEGLVSTLVDSKEDFLKVTKMHILVNELIERVYCYPRRFLDLDINDKKHKDMFDEALNIYSRIVSLSSKFSSIAIDNKDKVLAYLEDKEISFYKRYYEEIFNTKKYDDGGSFKEYQCIRNEYQELISKLEYGSIEVDGKNLEVTDATYPNLLLNENREVRRCAFESINETYLNVADKITELYIRKLKNDIKGSQEKGYKNLKEMKLAELELPSNLIDNTVSSVSEHVSIMHEYVDSKRMLVGEDDYYLYDSSMPKKEGGSSIDFESALNIADDCLSFLGSDYKKHLDILKNGSIDAMPKKGKRTLDFTGITYAGIPYMCLNYNNKMSGVRTLIHEYGHAVNLLYSKESNDFTYFEFSLFLTEVVAKVNEAIFNNYSVNKNENVDIPSILSIQLNSIFNQIMFTEFEDRVVKLLESDKEVNTEVISEIYEELLTKYNGDVLSKHEYNKYGWLRISHFIMQEPFYLYQYSIGTILANVIYERLASQMLEKEKYLEFLGIGSRMNIIDSLKFIGIDLFDKNIFDNAFTNLDIMVKKLKG